MQRELNERAERLQKEIDRVNDTNGAVNGVLVEKHMALEKSIEQIRAAITNSSSSTCEEGCKSVGYLAQVVDIIEDLDAKLDSFGGVIRKGTVGKPRHTPREDTSVRDDISRLKVTLVAFALNGGGWVQ